MVTGIFRKCFGGLQGKWRTFFVALSIATMLLASGAQMTVKTDGGIPSLAVEQAQAGAASCRNLGVYTDYFWHGSGYAPAIWIWNGSVRPDPNKMTIYYFNGIGNEVVWSPSDWGVRTDAPQRENANGWYVYYIATRWHSWHRSWNDDWRWSVKYCG